MSQTEIFERLAQRFDVEDHKKNPRGFTYIAIEKVIARFQEVYPAWELRVLRTEVSPLPGVTFGNRNPKPAGYALVVVEVTIDGVTRGGVGGAFQALENVDDMVKTAFAEAIKKAGHEFGVGLYLWDEEERALIDSAQAQGLTGQVVSVTQANAAAGSDDYLATLKNRVADFAESAGVMRTGPAIAAHYGVTVEQLQDVAVLEGIWEGIKATDAALMA